MTLRSTLARCLIRARKARGWTQAAAAEAAGLSVRQYQRIESGEAGCTLDTVDRLASALGVPVASLLSSRC